MPERRRRRRRRTQGHRPDEVYRGAGSPTPGHGSLNGTQTNPRTHSPIKTSARHAAVHHAPLSLARLRPLMNHRRERTTSFQGSLSSI
uniref:uncharacterized protein LOC120809584 isoform X1 n=1 Tax=Gasterosteus aculeatus aculeatus TaxID=481459 RepID=UPI001A98DEB6|nr:uncharacterized protein LOC120809584 isoform X1 [Gasterosteus aculeatus aculeatus]